ncbi:MAG: DUF4976 domain-containing protein [Chloroflexi bacterium]|nr:DUF4976 domain-containing protein [Chloroflexota bacterium]
MSDNGEAWGEHRLSSAKNCPYEECIRVPFIVYYPALITEARVEEKQVLNIDIAATIADLVGIPIPGSVDGISFLPLLTNPDAPWREGFIIEHWRTEEGFGSILPDFVGIRTAKWKYIRYETGELELYDLENDPYELENLANQISYQSTLELLDSQLDDLLVE